MQAEKEKSPIPTQLLLSTARSHYSLLGMPSPELFLWLLSNSLLKNKLFFFYPQTIDKPTCLLCKVLVLFSLGTHRVLPQVTEWILSRVL